MPRGARVGVAYVDIFPRFADFTKEVGRGLAGLTNAKALRNLGAGLTKAVTLPILAIGGASLKAAIDFESAFAGVRKTVDATEPQFAALEQGIRDMARQLPASAVEISKVAEAAGQLGIQRDAILGFTRTMIDLGETTNLTADEAASSLARIANIVQLPQDQFDRLGSTIVALGNAGASTESEIVSMALRIAGAGNQIGLTVDQTLAFANALSSVGISAEAGGSAISRVFIGIANEVASGGEKLETFAKVAGVSVEEFSAAFREDAAGAMVSFIEGLDRTAKSGGNVFEVLDQLGLSEVRVRDALLRAAGAGDLFRQSLELGSDAWRENRALTDEARKRYETTASKLEVLKNKVVDVGISIGRILVPVLDSLVTVAQPIIGGIAKLVEGFESLPGPIKTVGFAFVGLAAAAGPVLYTIGRLSLALRKGGAIHTGLGLLGKGFQKLLPKTVGGAALLGRYGAALGLVAKAAAPLAVTLFGVSKLFESQQKPIDALVAKMEQGTAAVEEFDGVQRGLFSKALIASTERLRAFANSADGLKFIGAEARKTAHDFLVLASQTENNADQGILLQGAWKALREGMEDGRREANRTALAAERTGENVEDMGESAGDAQEGFEDLEQALSDFNKTLNRTLGVTIDADEAADDYVRAQRDLADQIKENGPIFKGNSDKALDNRDAFFRAAEGAEAYIDGLILSGQASVESKPDLLIAELNKLAKKFGKDVPPQIQKYIDKVRAADRLTITNPVTQPGMSAALDNLRSLQRRIGDIGSIGIRVFSDQAEGRQHGGPIVAGRPYVVGEKGPELIVPKFSGRVIPHMTANIEGLSSGAYAGATFEFNISGEGMSPGRIAHEIDRILERRLRAVGQRVEARQRVRPRTQVVNG